MNVIGKLENGVISCNPKRFNYSSNVSNINSSLAVFWGNRPLDNPNNVHVNIYRCWDLHDSCERCLSLDEKYGCGWCERSNNCETSQQCGPDVVWYHGSHKCIDPVIECVSSVSTDNHDYPNSYPKGTPAGGANIVVVGKRLDHAKTPRLYVLYNGTRYSNTCEVQSSNLMKCKTPTIKATIGNTTIPQHVEYGFDMNPFPGFQNMSKQLNNSFLLYNDPIYYNFFDEIKIYSGHDDDYLTINGKYLNLVFDERDVQVRIGIGVCNVSSISNTQLTCKPPVKQPPNRLNDNQKGTTELPNVTVIVANTLMFYVGKMNYSQPEPQGKGDSVFKTALCASIFICISVAILISYVCCTSTEKAKKVQKNLQRQMDILEVRVAAEYKKEFAEL
ncbi:hypothetical protein WDU94_005213 [Cyamophila willieti]